jgi:metal-sulfur cluster biosynthetic enzyme
MTYECDYDAQDIFDELSSVLDPERGHLTLADLDVISPETITVEATGKRHATVTVQVKPTVPHCHLMTIIALSIRARLHFTLPVTTFWKVQLIVPHASHLQAEEIERQVNDKERVAAAMENPTVMNEINRFINPFGGAYGD